MQTVGSAPAAVERFVRALGHAGFARGSTVLNAFSAAWPALERQSREALALHGCRAVSPQACIADAALRPSHFIGPPDRFHALCRSGYAAVFSHAMLAGGAVFPVVRRLAELNRVALVETMADDVFGPYALRLPGERLFRPLEGVEVCLVRPGSEAPLPEGRPGEVLLRAEGTEVPYHRTGVISQLELVPHRQRKPGLAGWMGAVRGHLPLGGGREVGTDDMAALLAYHEAVLDARLVLEERDGGPLPVLQVETEAGAWIEDDLAHRFKAMTGVVPVIERIVPGALPATGRVFASRAARPVA